MKSRFLCKGLSQPWGEVLCHWGRGGAGRGRTAQCVHVAASRVPAVLRQPLGSPCRTRAAHSSVQVPEERQSDALWQEYHEEGSPCCRPRPPPLRGVGTADLCLGAVRRLWGSGRVWGGHGWAEAFGKEAPSPREVDVNWKGGQKPPARSIPDVWRAEGPGSGAEIAGPTRIWGQAPRGGNCKASLASVKTHLGRSGRVQPVQQPGPCALLPLRAGGLSRLPEAACASNARLKHLLIFKNIFSLLLSSSYTVDSCSSWVSLSC